MSIHQRQMNLNPWEQAFCWFWYNDDEIFKYTQEDFDARAKELADSGITIILTFSLTHFRLGYYPYWKEINECLRKIVVACHRYGIRVVEHHSSHLTHKLLVEGGWEAFDSNLFTYSRGGAKYDTWKKVYPFLTCDFHIDGKDLRSFSQVDGRTGEPLTTQYHSYGMCFNNPFYRKTYFAYLKDVVATGIDGIMNDDVQYFGDGNGCACEHCRKLFFEETGYTLPTSKGWSSFFENYDDPAYIAWKRFKFASTERFYRDLSALYESFGVKLLRPNYCSDILKHSPTCYPFSRCMDIWDFVFQENCFSAVIKQSYLDFMVESVHRYAAGKRKGVPSMSMFYPDRQDSTYFSWALARSWGQLYTGTCEGIDTTPLERPYRQFEEKYRKYYTAPEKVADISFYLSLKTRDFTKNARYRFMQKMLGGMQAAYEARFGIDMVMERDSLEELSKHGTIVSSYVAMADDEELSKLASYVRNGGRLIILGDFAVYREDGSMRSTEELECVLGIALKTNACTPYGKGEYWKMDFESVEPEFQPTIWSNRRIADPQPSPAVLSKRALRLSGTARVLDGIIKDRKFRLACEEDRIAMTAYGVEDAMTIHLVNLADTLAEAPCMAAHTDLFDHFMEGAEKLPAITLTYAQKLLFKPSSVTLATPETEKEIALDWRYVGEAIEIDVPGDTFSGYAMVMLNK